MVDITTRELRERDILRQAEEILRSRLSKGTVLDQPETTRKYLQMKIADKPSEEFGGLFLDNRHRIIHEETMFYGTIDGANVYPRVVAQKALRVNAAALIVYHNHPSGTPEPSHADRALTRRLKDALDLVDVRLLDHIVVGYEGTVSFAERGWI